MNFKEYGDAAATTAIYPGRGTWAGMLYCVSELVGEIGECFNVVKKMQREGISDKYIEKLKGEFGGVMWSWSQIYYEAGIERFLSELKDSDKESFDIRKELISNFPEYATEFVDERIITLYAMLHCMLDAASSLHEMVLLNEYAGRLNGLEEFPEVLTSLCKYLGFELSEVMQNNLDLLAARAYAGTLTGSGDGVEGRNGG